MNLRCLKDNPKAMDVAKKSIEAAGSKLFSDKEKVSVNRIQKILHSNRINLDNDAVAYLYRDVFSDKFNSQHKLEYESLESLDKYSKKATNIESKFKKALTKAFPKTDKQGKTILDWKALMYNKTDDEIIESINKLGFGLSPKENSELLDTLKGNWGIILGKAKAKALGRNISGIQKTAVEKLGELEALGLKESMPSIYNEALSKLLGVPKAKETLINDIAKLQETINKIKEADYGMDSPMLKDLEDRINSLIEKAQRVGYGVDFYNSVNAVSKVFQLANLSILNNISGFTTNIVSNLMGVAQRGVQDVVEGRNKVDFVGKLSAAYGKNVALHNQTGFNDANTTFSGQVDLVKEMLGSEKPAVNGIVNTIMGVTQLNATDAMSKVKGTWMRFIENAEQLMKKNNPEMNMKEIRAKLNEKINGETFAQAKQKATEVIDKLIEDGADIKKTDATITIFASDIIRAQLVENGLLTKEDLHNAWTSAYKVAGMALGHVPNNFVSKALNTTRSKLIGDIKKALKEGNRNQAAVLALKELVFVHILNKFIGGGSNWLWMQIENAGVGLVSGGVGLAFTGNKNLGNVSNMTNNQIRESLEYRQKNKDKVYRGATGLTMLTLSYLALSGLFDDDDEKKKLMAWLDKHPELKKMLYKNVPSILSVYLSYLEQSNIQGTKENKEIAKGLFNTYKYNALRNQLFNLLNLRTDTDLEKYIGAIGGMFSDKDDKIKKGQEAIIQKTANLLNINVLPTQGVLSTIQYAPFVDDFVKKIFNIKEETARKALVEYSKEYPRISALLEGWRIFKKTGEEKGYTDKNTIVRSKGNPYKKIEKPKKLNRNVNN